MIKYIIKIPIVILVLLISNKAVSQTYRVDNSSSHRMANLLYSADQFKHITSQASSVNNTRNISSSNNVYIQQIGNENNIISNTQSVYSDIGLFQKGNNNEVLLNITAAALSEHILQTGINNSVINLSSKASILHKTTVFQKGANQNLIMLGSNSISNNMIISMQGKGQTILVRNIKN